MKQSLSLVALAFFALSASNTRSQSSILPIATDGDSSVFVDAPYGATIQTTIAASGQSRPNETEIALKESENAAFPAAPVADSAGAQNKTACAKASSSEFNECYKDDGFEYVFLGGIEQSDLSAQSSVSEGFYDLFLREPFNDHGTSIWFRSRYLGTPSSSSTQNVIAAATNPTGTLTASNLPQSVTAIDYTVGLQFYDFPFNGKDGKTTITPIIGFGATTPLSASTVVSGFAVPAYGTNECAQLLQRFTTQKGYSPALPGSGVYDSSGDIGCVVQPNSSGTTSSSSPGTQIKDIGFSNEDRSSFLLKWGAGIRIMDRWGVDTSDTTTACHSATGCTRITADIGIGQDQAITGGFLRQFVLKADAVIPILKSGVYFFAASDNRIARNTILSPLILSPVTLATNTSTSTCTASSTTVCFPSSSVFILPYKQQNRDYYRIGIGIDAVKILKGLFNPPSS
jgi:hypothetical protein